MNIRVKHLIERARKEMEPALFAQYIYDVMPEVEDDELNYAMHMLVVTHPLVKTDPAPYYRLAMRLQDQRCPLSIDSSYNDYATRRKNRILYLIERLKKESITRLRNKQRHELNSRTNQGT